MNLLPPEIIWIIASHLPVADLISFTLTSTRYQALSEDVSLWELKAKEDFWFPSERFRQSGLSPIDRYFQIKNEEIYPGKEQCSPMYHCLGAATGENRPDLLEYFHSVERINELFLQSIREGALEEMKRYCQEGAYDFQEGLIIAIKTNNQDAIRYILSFVSPARRRRMIGNIIGPYLKAKGSPDTIRILLEELLPILLSQEPELVAVKIDLDFVWNQALRNYIACGEVDIVKFMLDRYPSQRSIQTGLNQAASNNHLSIGISLVQKAKEKEISISLFEPLRDAIYLRNHQMAEYLLREWKRDNWTLHQKQMYQAIQQAIDLKQWGAAEFLINTYPGPFLCDIIRKK